MYGSKSTLTSESYLPREGWQNPSVPRSALSSTGDIPEPVLRAGQGTWQKNIRTAEPFMPLHGWGWVGWRTMLSVLSNGFRYVNDWWPHVSGFGTASYDVWTPVNHSLTTRTVTIISPLPSSTPDAYCYFVEVQFFGPRAGEVGPARCSLLIHKPQLRRCKTSNGGLNDD